MAEYIEREALLRYLNDIWLSARPNDFMPDDDRQLAMVRCMGLNDAMDAVKTIPAAGVPSALWTGDPISGTEFMTHNQGQSGFEIHFRTDDKAKYEAVQDECRRQIGHAKPAADVRPVVLCRDCKHWKLSKIDPSFHVCQYVCGASFVRNADDFCSRGEKREES